MGSKQTQHTPFTETKALSSREDLRDRAVLILCGSDKTPCSISLVSKLPCCNMTAAEFCFT